jgi:glutamate synthase (ferredoxin)
MSNNDPSKVDRLLADPRSERAACGIGFIAHLSGRPSHSLLIDALATISRLAHRGAVAADARTGDGAGVLTQIPYSLFERELSLSGITPPARGDLAVGFCFLPSHDHNVRARAKQIVANAIVEHGLELLTWRKVPIDLDALGDHARKTCPRIEQVLVARTSEVGAGDEYERRLYIARKEIERRARDEGIQPLYLPSFSSRTVVYKGLFVSPQLAPFYCDLRDPAYETALALFHQRYSTNTFPTWERAQPFRFLCHNGEINTLQGNIAWMRGREPHLASPLYGDSIKSLLPVLDTKGSDSAMLDNALELLALSGRDSAHSLMMLVPEAWENVRDLPPAWKSFYHYHSTLMEPWDGPAALAFSDGRMAGMALDRNGLRPARYVVMDDGLVVAASETGAYEADPEHVIEKGKLGPGQMVLADLATGKLWHNNEIKDYYASQKPYEEWLSSLLHKTRNGRDDPETTQGGFSPIPACSSISLQALQAAFGYTDEELGVVVRHMAEDGIEPIASMGDDTPHAVLSEFERPLYHFFKQRFAEVTNPPIDPIREQLVMSTRVLLGARGNILEESTASARLLELSSPFLTDERIAKIQELEAELPQAILNTTFPVSQLGGTSLESALADLCKAAESAVEAGKVILILSDRAISRTHAPIPMLLATSAVHNHLLQVGKRWKTSIIADAGDARDVHHLACLIGFGANAVHPYLALESVRSMVAEGHSRKKELAPERAEENFIHAAEKGLLKIMSKMGIATLDAYHGAQIFECLGLADSVAEKYFCGTPSLINGADLGDIAAGVLVRHAHAFGQGANRLKSYGLFKYKKPGEYHAYSPDSVRALNEAVRTPGALNGNYREAYEKYLGYAALVHARPATDLADHLDIQFGDPIPVEGVEPVAEIVKRFSSAAMSHGALSLEAHEAIAIALNRIGAKSNSGEGGEHPSRYGTESNSPIKQVASARFGVTPAYLMSADELQIKMAQGSKPGEGGQLPAHKVSVEIAAIRHAQPGTALISPPPHHDIYSIEDLAQLIYDLKRVNPRARVSVKLVAQAGIGTIAAGVAKAHADIIQISGHSGGTGASPLSSIKNAGSAWELGLAETQQILVANELRERVRLRVDGGLMTARHVIIGALLGADEFSFGTAPLIAAGCMMARACHLNTCPTGIATQDPKLRSKFANRPEWIMAYFLFLAEETRQYLAAMGFQAIDEIIGRVELLRQSQLRAQTYPAFLHLAMSIPAPMAF